MKKDIIFRIKSCTPPFYIDGLGNPFVLMPFSVDTDFCSKAAAFIVENFSCQIQRGEYNLMAVNGVDEAFMTMIKAHITDGKICKFCDPANAFYVGELIDFVRYRSLSLWKNSLEAPECYFNSLVSDLLYKYGASGISVNYSETFPLTKETIIDPMTPDERNHLNKSAFAYYKEQLPFQKDFSDRLMFRCRKVMP